MILPSNWAVPQIFRDRLGKTAGAQRAMVADGHLLLVLHRLPEPGERQRDRQGSFFWRDTEGKWQCTGRGGGMPMLRKHLQDHEAAIQQLEDSYEGAGNATDYFEVLETLGPMRRATRGLATTLQAAREAIPEDRELIVLRDWAAEIDRTTELVQLDARNALDFSIARQAEQQAAAGRAQARAGHRLNLLAAIFFPLTAVGSVLGMNLTSGLESSHPLLFWAVFAGGLLLGLIVKALVTSKGVTSKGTDSEE